MFHVRTKHPKFYLKKENYQFLDFYREHKIDKPEESNENQEYIADSLQKPFQFPGGHDESKVYKEYEMCNNLIQSRNSAFSFINKNTRESATQTDFSNQTSNQTSPFDYEFNGKLVDFCKKSIDLIDYAHNILTLNNSDVPHSQGINHHEVVVSNFKENILPVKTQLDSIYYEIEKRRKIFSFLKYYQKDYRIMH